MGINFGDKQVKNGWYQDKDRPNIYRAYINAGAAGMSRSAIGNKPGDLIYEIDLDTGASTILSSQIKSFERTAIWQANGSQAYQPVNINNDAIKTLKENFGLDLTALKKIDQGYAVFAANNLPFSNAAKKRLLEKARFTTPAPAVTPPPGAQGGGNSNNGDASGPNAGGATQTPVFTPLNSVTASTFENESTKNYGSAVYPVNQNAAQSRMVISIQQYQIPDVFAADNSSSVLSGADLSYRDPKKIVTKGTVTLPMPSNLTEANQTGWGENSMSSLAAGLMDPAVKAVSTAAEGNLYGAAQVTVQAAQDIFRGDTPAKKTIQQLLTLNAASAAIKKLGVQIDAEAYRARATGTVINPNLELLFNGPKLRVFNFSYRLVARSVPEAKQIRKLIKIFKKAMAPKRSVKGSNQFFLGAPDVFRIDFKFGKGTNKYLPSLKTCALTNFSANYTGDGFYSSYVDGQPLSVDINLVFAELTPIYNDHYNMSEDGVGFSASLAELESSFGESASAKPPTGSQGANPTGSQGATPTGSQGATP